MPPLPFVSGPSANALLSDLRPTTLTAPALDYVNDLLDELLVSLITAAASLNPLHLRTRGIPAVFAPDRDTPITEAPQGHSSVGPLALSAVGEAEVEIRGWYESHPTARKGVSGFPPAGAGTGVLSSTSDAPSDAPFPVTEAVELMRVEVSMFSTFAPNAPPQQIVDGVLEAWQGVAGDTAEETISPAGLWITAILEHVSEHVLTKLSQVVARDSSVTAAGVQDLYTALCEDDSVYSFFKHMNVRNVLETEVHAETDTRRRRPVRTASGSVVPRAQSPVGTIATTGSIGSAHGSKASLTSQADNRKSLLPTPSRSSSEHFKSTPRASTSTPAQSHHKRTPSALSLSKHSNTEAPDIFHRRNSSDIKAEEDFDAFLRSGETMRVSLTPSRFSTFESSPASSPIRHEMMRPGNALSVPPSSSETSLLSSSTQASTAESGRIGPGHSHRQVAGRSWSSASKLMPRDAAIEEKDEEESNERPSLMELIRKEKNRISEHKPAPLQMRTVPAVILGSPPSSPDPDTPATARSDLPPRAASLHVTADIMSDPGDSPRNRPETLARSVRSASEGAPDLPPTGTFRRNTVRSDRVEMQKETRDIANFFATPPPKAPVHADQPHSKHRMPSFRNIMTRMKKDKSSKDSDRRPLNSPASTPTLRVSTPSSEQGLLRTQKSSSSVASGSTVMALAVSTNSMTGSAEPPRVVSPSPQPSETSSTKKKPRELLRKPSLVRKWAAQVTSSDHRSIARQGSPRSLGSQIEEDDESSANLSQGSQLKGSTASSSHQREGSSGNISASSVQQQNRHSRGLGLGGVEFPEAFGFSGNEDTVQGREAAFGQLTGGSKGSSPVGSRFDLDAKISPKTTDVNVIPSNSGSPRLNVLHPRVADLAREGDDNVASIPFPVSIPLASPTSPEISSALAGNSSVADSIMSEEFVSAEEMEELDDDDVDDMEHEPELDTPEPGATETPSMTIGTPEFGSPGGVSISSSANNAHVHGYLPVADLMPLRHLLDNATSVRECQLLLDAILSQLGVPRQLSAGVSPTPEDRVAAWLLAGREGPVGDRAISAPRLPRALIPNDKHSRNTSLSSEVTMKSLPALPPGMVGPASSLDALSKRKVDLEAEAVAAAVAADNLARRLGEQRLGHPSSVE